MSDDTIRVLDLRRLQVLEEQAAQMGIETPAHITTQIRELRAKYKLPDVASNPKVERSVESIERRLDLVLSQVQIAVAAGIKVAERATRIEERYHEDRAERHERQEKQDEQWEHFQTQINRNWIAVLLLAVALLLLVTVAGLLFLLRGA